MKQCVKHAVLVMGASILFGLASCTQEVEKMLPLISTVETKVPVEKTYVQALSLLPAERRMKEKCL